MKKSRVYVESSIPSMLTSRPSRDVSIAAMQNWTRRWWEERRGDFELFISDFVRIEIQDGDADAAALRMDAIRGIEILEDVKTTRRFARKLIRRLSLPRDGEMDAYHIAIAIENGIEYLLTWNSVHIANPVNLAPIQELAARRGFKMPVICTPVISLEEMAVALNPLEEIRAARRRIMRDFDYDLDKLCDHLAAVGKAEGRKYVSLKPRRIKKPSGTATRTTPGKLQKSSKPKTSARGRKSA